MLRSTGYVGRARDVATRLLRRPLVTEAVTDVDVWAALARDSRRAVLLLEGVATGRLFGHDLGDDVASACGVAVRVVGDRLHNGWSLRNCLVVERRSLGLYEAMRTVRRVDGPGVSRRDLRRVAGLRLSRKAIPPVRRALHGYVANIIHRVRVADKRLVVASDIAAVLQA